MADSDRMEVEQLTIDIYRREGLGEEGEQGMGDGEWGNGGERLQRLTPEVRMTVWKREKTGWLASVGSIQLPTPREEREERRGRQVRGRESEVGLGGGGGGGGGEEDKSEAERVK